MSSVRNFLVHWSESGEGVSQRNGHGKGIQKEGETSTKVTKSEDIWKGKPVNKPVLLGHNKHCVFMRQYQRRHKRQILESCVSLTGYALTLNEVECHVFQVFNVVTDFT